MTDTVQVALIAGAGPFILAFATLWTSMRNGKKANTLIAKSDVIHELTNSNLSKVKSDLTTANERIEKLEALLTKLVPGNLPK